MGLERDRGGDGGRKERQGESTNGKEAVLKENRSCSSG